MKRFLLASFAMLLCTLSVGLFAPYSASAQSVYDDALQLTDEVLLIRNSHTLNVSTTYLSYIEEPSQYCTQSQIDNLQSLLNNSNSNWFITESTIATDFTQMHFVISNDPDVETIFIDYGGEIHTEISGITNQNSASYSLLLQTNGNVSVTCSDYILTQTLSISTGNPRLFLSTFPVDYPPEYSGPIIPDTYNPPIVEPPPEFQFTYTVADKQITLYDVSDLTLGQTECYFQITPNATQVYTELHFDCDLKQSVTHTVDEYGLYDILLIYVTPTSYKSSIVRTIDIDGSSFSDSYGYAVNEVFYKCIYSELPFINFMECYNNVLIFAGMLSFDRIQFGTDFTPPDGCRNLVVLGSWIGASTNTVCPMIPSYIRDIITPFVTFLLGLLMLQFITSRGGGGFS